MQRGERRETRKRIERGARETKADRWSESERERGGGRG